MFYFTFRNNHYEPKRRRTVSVLTEACSAALLRGTGDGWSPAPQRCCGKQARDGLRANTNGLLTARSDDFSFDNVQQQTKGRSSFN